MASTDSQKRDLALKRYEKDEAIEVNSGSEKTDKDGSEENDKDEDKKDDNERDKDEDEKEEVEETLKIGNFSLRGSQQPGPLLGLGEHVVDEGQAQIYLSGGALIGRGSYATGIVATFIYGISDELSFRFDLPYALGNKDGSNKSSGMEDVIIELEYAFYTKSAKCWAEQATIVGAVTIPSGSRQKDPQTGLGAPSYLLALTFNHTAIDWFCFGAVGTVLTTRSDGFTAGKKFLYQYGIGRDICTPPGWIYAWMVEGIGQYIWRDSLNGNKDADSGGNTIFIAPSLWASSDHLILQLGMGVPVLQNLFGDQSHSQLGVYFNFGWTF